MRIAIVSTFLGQKWAGGEISTFLLTKNLSQKVEVVAVTAKVTQKMPFKCYNLPLLKRIPNEVLIIGHRLIDYYIYRKLLKIFAKEKPDVIHVHDFWMLIGTIKAAKKLKIPVITTVRSTTFACNLSICLEGNKIPFRYGKRAYKKWLYQTFERAYNRGWLSYFLFGWFYKQNQRMRKWFKRVDYYICVSDFVKSNVMRVGIDQRRISTIYVQKAEWELVKYKGEMRVFSAGTLTKFKGFEYVIRAFARIVKKYPDATLRIAGEGSERSRLERLIVHLGLRGKVILLGKIAHEQMREEYGRACVVLAPSIGPESLSRIIFEGMSMKRAVVATNVGGNSELVINRKTGLLVEPLDVKGISEAIITLIENLPLRKRIEGNGFAKVTKQSNEGKIIKEHVKVYTRMVKKKL